MEFLELAAGRYSVRDALRGLSFLNRGIAGAGLCGAWIGR